MLRRVTDRVDGVDRALARFRAVAAAAAIERHALHTAETETRVPARARDVPDGRQLIGVPVFVIKTPAWRRQDWAVPQQPPTKPR
jgi:hypothetical protein